MKIGVPKEIKEQESRVAALPSVVYQLTKLGHQVYVERDAGVGAGYPDREYQDAGAIMSSEHAEIFREGDLIVKVKEPLPPEYPLLREGQILFTYLHLAATRSLTEELMRTGVTAIAYETVEINRRLPLLEPMSEIAGRMSIIVGGYFLAKHSGGIPRRINVLCHNAMLTAFTQGLFRVDMNSARAAVDEYGLALAHYGSS